MSFNPAPTALSNEPTEPVPPSVVASGTGLPSAPKEYAEAQQAATAPGTGGVVEQPGAEGDKITFKDQVNGYAKKFAGAVFRNEGEKEFGEKKLQGEA
ncbi:hypothetical protein I302_101214 [Kwoniella bestiolae CBS 10118]|uniref:Uncharacterized protein n=1 Tax=Kwoniella bestiolae CBS 10118 TaxID=1296100 RepID=A0A1B9G789_9TREE|nr:hypothetical protein I302_04587 [Kwoniella bestiolae CBS 10118]OCF26897.1 hypothetical protein I302_04587 [Kwoniella bestiolae CBS 10118]